MNKLVSFQRSCNFLKFQSGGKFAVINLKVTIKQSIFQVADVHLFLARRNRLNLTRRIMDSCLPKMANVRFIPLVFQDCVTRM